jgi:nucleoside 2-deoxyribosyltransferase
MKKAYLSIGYQNRKRLEAEISALQEVLSAWQVALFVFVDQYHFTPQQETEMMQQAFRDISSSDLLLAEVSEKAIGVGIEIGYAVALGKPVIYLRQARAEHSTTASGSAGYSVIYSNAGEISQLLTPILAKLAHP